MSQNVEQLLVLNKGNWLIFLRIDNLVYLLAGLCCMMLFLATLYSVRQLNLTRFFLIRDESEYTDPSDEQKLKTVNQVSSVLMLP